MIFTVLGSGTHLAHPHRGPAGFLISHGETRLLVDGGSGTVQRLARAGVNPLDLDGGLYSHRHLDHCGDLPSILFSMNVSHLRRRERDYPIWAGDGFAAFMADLAVPWPRWFEPERFRVPVHELPLDGPGHAMLPGGIALDTSPANHEDGALHLRFTAPDGATAVFSGDTGPSANLVELSRAVDLLVCECALPEGYSYDYHLSARQVAEVVAEARPRRVVLTHFYPRKDPEADVAVVAATGVSTERASDNQAFPVEPLRSGTP